jgi:hypothetical protein
VALRPWLWPGLPLSPIWTRGGGAFFNARNYLNRKVRFGFNSRHFSPNQVNVRSGAVSGHAATMESAFPDSSRPISTKSSSCDGGQRPIVAV